MQTLLTNDLKRLGNLLGNIQANVSQANQILSSLVKAELAPREAKESEGDQYKDVPGIEGTFDGVFMTTADGQKIEVPVNYSAKSRLVYGDTLKMIKVKEGGQEEKTLFKQVVKVPRKRIEGVLSKKDGKWHLLTESNSYRILDRAAEFNGALQNDIAFGLIPEGNMIVPFASLDFIKKSIESAPVIHAPIHKVDLPKPVVAPPSKRRIPPRASKKEFISDLRSETKLVQKPTVTTPSAEEDDLR